MKVRQRWVLWIVGSLFVGVGGGCATSLTPDTGSLFYPAPPQRPRVQFLTQFAAAGDVEGAPSALTRFLVGDVSSERRLRKPAGVASHDGVIYVADPGWNTVLVLDVKEHLFETLGDHGEGKLQVPIAIAVDERGEKFVADSGRKQIVQFNARNEFVAAFGNPNSLQPSGVAVNERYLYVSDRNRHRILVLDRRSRERVRTIGKFGKRKGQFNIPTSLSLDPNGDLYVTDMGNFRIQQFDSKGKFVQEYGFLGDGPGTFARPKGTAVDREGYLYTIDAAFEIAQIWDTSSGQVVLAFGGPGVGPGQMYLPASVSIDYDLNPYFQQYVDPAFDLDYVILVGNNYGPNKVAVYGFVSPKDPDRYPVYPLPDEEDED